MNEKNNNTNLEHKKGINKLEDLIKEKLFDGNVENNEEFRLLKYDIHIAYNLMKKIFNEDSRNTGERYFEHLREVANIVLNFIDNPNKEKVLIALLHDCIEDKNVSFELLAEIFGNKIAIAVLGLSKKSLENYKIEGGNNNEEELKIRRNKDYFGHLESFDSMLKYVKELVEIKNITDLSEEDLIEITNNIIDVKLADRIHNIGTQWDKNNRRKVLEKIEETEKYFLKVAKNRDIKIYDKLKKIILDLKIKLCNVEYDVNLLLEYKN